SLPWPASSSILARKVCTTLVERALVAFWLRPLAESLSMLLQQQVRAPPGMKLLWNFRLNQRLPFAIVDAVVLALQSMLDPYQYRREIRGPRGNGLQMPEEQNAIRARICDAGKPLQCLANFIQRTFEPRHQIAAELVLYALCDLLHPHRPQLRHHSTGFKRC